MYHLVHYRIVPHASMPTGPVCLALRPDSHVLVLADETYIDPTAPRELEQLGSAILARYTRLATPSPISPIRVRIHRMADVGDGRLVAAEITPTTIDVLVDNELIRPGFAVELGRHTTQIMRHFT